MKKISGYFVTVILGSLLLFSCKKDADPYIFPSAIIIESKDCLQIWESLNFQVSNDYGSNIYLYSVYVWYGASEGAITINPLKTDYSTDGTKFTIGQNQIGENKYIFVQLKGYASDKGFVGDSKIYKFKKTINNNCTKWISY